MRPGGVWRTAVVAGVMLVGAGTAHGQTSVSLPNSTQTTTLTANVTDQARVTVPAGVSALMVWLS